LKSPNAIEKLPKSLVYGTTARDGQDKIHAGEAHAAAEIGQVLQMCGPENLPRLHKPTCFCLMAQDPPTRRGTTEFSGPEYSAPAGGFATSDSFRVGGKDRQAAIPVGGEFAPLHLINSRLMLVTFRIQPSAEFPHAGWPQLLCHASQLWLRRMPFTISAGVGFIVLIRVAVSTCKSKPRWFTSRRR
jgi:hypothetical protein